MGLGLDLNGQSPGQKSAQSRFVQILFVLNNISFTINPDASQPLVDLLFALNYGIIEQAFEKKLLTRSQGLRTYLDMDILKIKLANINLTFIHNDQHNSLSRRFTKQICFDFTFTL